MKTEPFDLMTYVNADITFRGTIPRRSLPGEDRCRQNEVITLEETALTYACQVHAGVLVPSSSKGRRPAARCPSRDHPPRLREEPREEHASDPRQRVMNCLAVGGGDREK